MSAIVTVRKGYGPRQAVLVATKRAEWVDPWGLKLVADEVVSVTPITPTDRRLPAIIEAGTNGTGAVEPLVYVDQDGNEFYTMGGGLWSNVADDSQIMWDTRWGGFQRFLLNGQPATAAELDASATTVEPPTPNEG